MQKIMFLLLLFLVPALLTAQDKAEYQTKFIWDKDQQFLSADFSKIKKPTLADFKNALTHNDPVRQDTTGTCWSYSTLSFFESEIYRLNGRKIKLAEMYVVYWEYVEKARRFIQEKGNSVFDEGSESNAAVRRIGQYGIVPFDQYTGLINGRTKHSHGALKTEMSDYLLFLKEHNYWDEQIAISTIKEILNKYIGVPPASFVYEGKSYTPQSFRDEVCQLKTDEYVDFMSTMKFPFFNHAELEVRDNWWHSTDYVNVPLDDFYKAIKNAVRSGYTIAIGGDVSEPGKYGWEDIAIIVPWDIPQEAINQSSRELRIYNNTTTDDHGLHLVGYTQKGGHDWYLIKDSGASGTYGQCKGYYFFRDDFIKLKMLSFTVHKAAVKDLLIKVTD